MTARVSLFFRTIGLLFATSALAGLVVCGVNYLLTAQAKPFVDVEPAAQSYLKSSVLLDAASQNEFMNRLQLLAGRTRTSIVVTYVDRPKQGELLKDAVDAKVADVAKATAARSGDRGASTAVLVLIGKPRSFAVKGLDLAETKLFLRNLSAKPAYRSLQLRHAQARDGRHLLDAIGLIEGELRPLSFWVEHHPFPEMVARLIQELTDNWSARLPPQFAAGLLEGLKGLVAIETAVSPIVFFLAGLIVLSLAVETVVGAVARLFPSRAHGTAFRALSRAVVSVPVVGIVAIVAYGSLEEIASLSQMSGEDVRTMARVSRTLNNAAVPVPPLLALLAAFIITAGVGLEFFDGDADKLMASIQRWLASPFELVGSIDNPLVALVARCILLAGIFIVAAIPIAVLLALFSMEGLMGLVLLPVLTVQWGRGFLLFVRNHLLATDR